MKIPRRLLSILVLMVLTLSLMAACGDSATPTTSAPTSAATSAAPTASGPVKLTFSTWGNDAQNKLYQDMAVKFKEKYPNITVEVQAIPFADYQQKLSIMIASKTAPDVAWVVERSVPQLIESNQLADITSLKTDSAYNFADIYPSTLPLFKKGEQVFGIPFSTPPMILFYNKNLFKEKSLKTPTELYKEGNWTYDEFLKAAKTITDPSKGVYGVKLLRDWKNWIDPLLPIVWSYGADVFNKDTTQFALNSAEGLKAVQLYSDMLFKEQVHPKPGDQITFETGKLGMYTDRYSNVAKARLVKDFEWDIAPMPKGPAGAATSLGLAGYAVIQGTKHPLEALEWLKFISNKDGMSITSQYFVPPRESVLKSDIFLKAAPQPSPESIQMAVLDQMTNARYNPGHRNWAKVDAAVLGQMDRLYTQSISVKDALSTMEKEVNPLLK